MSGARADSAYRRAAKPPFLSGCGAALSVTAAGAAGV